MRFYEILEERDDRRWDLDPESPKIIKSVGQRGV